VKYFAARGAYCPPTTNIAEFLLDAGVGNVRAHHHRVDWIQLWKDSPEFDAIKKEIENIVSTRKAVGNSLSTLKGREFAATTFDQTVILTKRLWSNYWRTPSYGYGNLFTTLSTAIVAGFTFWKLGNSLIDLQERLFAAFMFIFLPAPMLNSIIPKVLLFLPVLRSFSKHECCGKRENCLVGYMDGLPLQLLIFSAKSRTLLYWPSSISLLGTFQSDFLQRQALPDTHFSSS
jgi:hypothetical protein